MMSDSTVYETTPADDPQPVEGATCGWREGSPGVIGAVLAALCCAFPPVLTALGFTGAASVLSAMPFGYHLVLQWAAIGVLALGWVWFGWKWTKASGDVRWSLPNLVVGLIMLAATVYVLKSWVGHMFLMTKAPF